MRSRSYSELCRIPTFAERYEYLKLGGEVGDSTFGFDRWINQQFYTSNQWRNVRQQVILRDRGCDLGIEGYDILSHILIHHMNPITPQDIEHGASWILEPEFLITTTRNTHNAIHYGNASLLPQPLKPRTRGDTKLW